MSEANKSVLVEIIHTTGVEGFPFTKNLNFGEDLETYHTIGRNEGSSIVLKPLNTRSRVISRFHGLLGFSGDNLLYEGRSSNGTTVKNYRHVLGLDDALYYSFVGKTVYLDIGSKLYFNQNSDKIIKGARFHDSFDFGLGYILEIKEINL